MIESFASPSSTVKGKVNNSTRPENPLFHHISKGQLPENHIVNLFILCICHKIILLAKRAQVGLAFSSVTVFIHSTLHHPAQKQATSLEKKCCNNTFGLPFFILFSACIIRVF